jgi:SAM-dependent methyltransferase
MGFRERVMGIPWVYESFGTGIGKPESGVWFANEIIRAAPKARVLDVGCGPADVVSRLGDVSYLGIDHNPKYIETARARFGSRAEFHCWDVTDMRLTALGKFDIVLMLGVLHHLTDGEIHTMLQHASTTLKPTGRLITFDCAVDRGQHPIARILARLDRGRYARTTDRYRELISEHFTPVEVVVRHDLLRVPYTHTIITAIPNT